MVSAKGPSVVTVSPPRTRTVVAWEVSCSASPARIHPLSASHFEYSPYACPSLAPSSSVICAPAASSP
jgi:hypothetical protein